MQLREQCTLPMMIFVFSSALSPLVCLTWPRGKKNACTHTFAHTPIRMQHVATQPPKGRLGTDAPAITRAHMRPTSARTINQFCRSIISQSRSANTRFTCTPPPPSLASTFPYYTVAAADAAAVYNMRVCMCIHTLHTARVCLHFISTQRVARVHTTNNNNKTAAASAHAPHTQRPCRPLVFGACRRAAQIDK